MKLLGVIWRVGTTGLLIAITIPSVVARAITPPSLVISQFKITSSNGQFVTFYNQTENTIDLTQYEVDYINSTGKSTSLPLSGKLASHAFYMLSDDQVRLCYQMTIDATSLGFATTNGSLQVWQISADKTTKQLQDAITWASKATSGAVTLPTQNSTNSVSLLRQPTDSLGNPQVAAAAGGTWQAVAPDTINPCSLDIVSTTNTLSSPSSNPGNQLGLGQAPPATIINLVTETDGTNTPSLPAGDIGLSAAQLTELLPNPNGTGTDGTDEFIELYNSNITSFDLSGFTLQTGSTTKHSYTFPAGTMLPAQGFVAFYSADTGLSLSNTSGQADLLDPFTACHKQAYTTRQKTGNLGR